MDRLFKNTFSEIMISEGLKILIWVFFIGNDVASQESCSQFRRKENVLVDQNQCVWKNFSEPKPTKHCLQSCWDNDRTLVLN